MQKRTWNGSTEEWICERHYTKDEVDKKIGVIDSLIPHDSIVAIITYANGTSKTIRLLADEITED